VVCCEMCARNDVSWEAWGFEKARRGGIPLPQDGQTQAEAQPIMTLGGE
jgi:hypothetical protein